MHAQFIAEKDSSGRIIFHHSIAPGVADDAHAIEVASFAGHPPAVTSFAERVLCELQGQGFGRVDMDAIQAAMRSQAAPRHNEG